MEHILIYDDQLAGVEYSPNHPFKPSRARQMVELLQRHLLIHEPNQKIVPHEPLDESVLLRFHTPDYIEVLKQCEGGTFDLKWLEYGLGSSDNPIFKGLYSFALKASGGTYIGADRILQNQASVVFNPIGGFHHAMRDFAEGFCYINDAALAIIHMLDRGKRVAYVDTDAHHGDGVQEAFYGDDRVLTISLHESGYSLFPGTGFEDEIGEGRGTGYNVNIPFLKDSDDEVYLYAFEEIVPPLLQSFRPDVVVHLLGGDAHRDDPLANLNLTSTSYEAFSKRIRELVPAVLVLGGGGYNLHKTASMWALSWASYCGIKPEDHFFGSIGGMMYGPSSEAGHLHDEPFAIKGHRKVACMDHARAVVATLKKLVFPYHIK